MSKFSSCWVRVVFLHDDEEDEEEGSGIEYFDDESDEDIKLDKDAEDGEEK